MGEQLVAIQTRMNEFENKQKELFDAGQASQVEFDYTEADLDEEIDTLKKEYNANLNKSIKTFQTYTDTFGNYDTSDGDQGQVGVPATQRVEDESAEDEPAADAKPAASSAPGSFLDSSK